ncbi:MAG TPA: hypothetical protein VNK70_02640 [Candidatus Paceibacterota bacterium]|nr:hypothetical protein [Candidatus Paceibacterota bacterium]
MKYKILPESELSVISLRLEQYDDIFSDFDIRPYSSRALSVDFIDEIKRAAVDKNDGGIELILYVPKNERNESREAAIKERLVAHFRRHHHLLYQEKKKIMKLGLSMVVMGIFSMIAATFIIFKDPAQNIFLSFLVVFLEPAAWFLLWEGMDQVIFNSKNLNPDLEFYRKMSDPKGHIVFKSY